MHNKQRFSIVLIFMLFTAFFFSCNKSTETGIEIVPDDYLIKTNTADTFRVIAYTYRIDSIKTNNIAYGMLGSYIDPIFGELKASFVTEIIPSGSPNFGTNPVFDSAVLYLQFDTIYRDLTIEQEINISEIKKRIIFDSSYYNTFNPASLNPELISSFTFRPSDNDSLLALKLPYSFGLRVFNDAAIWKDTTFSTYFNGLLISSNQTAINGNISAFNLFHKNTHLSFFYKNSTDSLEYKFVVNSSSSARFNIIEQVYNSPGFLPDLESPESKEDSVVYLQGGAGLKVKIKFPQLDELRDQALYGVNRAEIVLNADPSTLSTSNIYPAPKYVAIYSIDDEGEAVPLPEYIGENAYIPIQYSDNKYKIDITFIAQQILSKKLNNNGFYIYVYDGNITPSRIVLTSGKHSLPMQLVLSLTKIPE